MHYICLKCALQIWIWIHKNKDRLFSPTNDFPYLYENFRCAFGRQSINETDIICLCFLVKYIDSQSKIHIIAIFFRPDICVFSLNVITTRTKLKRKNVILFWLFLFNHWYKYVISGTLGEGLSKWMLKLFNKIYEQFIYNLFHI